MNLHDLATRYKHLSAGERLPLILAAAARGDDVERLRLVESAPRVHFEAPHHYRLGEALFSAGHYHLISLLDLAAKYLEWWGLWGWLCLRAETGKSPGGKNGKRAREERAREARVYNLMRYHAYLFITYFDGWKQFCSELMIDAEMLLKDMPGWETAKRTDAAARENAFAYEDAVRFMASETIGFGPAPERLEVPPMPTVEALAREWHDLVDRRAEEGPERDQR